MAGITQRIKRFLQEDIIDPLSLRAVHEIVKQEADLRKIWEDSLRLIPDFRDHFNSVVANGEVEARIRLLIAYEVLFMKRIIQRFLKDERRCSYADVGDSDGSVRLLLSQYFSSDELQTVGVNLQKGAVEKMKKRGLAAISCDALELKNQGFRYDYVSAFETLEHLPHPLGFLRGIRDVVRKGLVISVPFIRKSRVGLLYLTNKWPQNKKPTIENVHIFELSPYDWEKIFQHTGWKIVDQGHLMMFPSDKLSRLILQPYWRYRSFEGFWFVALAKDDTFSSRYDIE